MIQEKCSNMWHFKIYYVMGTVDETIALALDRLRFYHVPL